MELVLNVSDVKALQENGTLATIIDTCLPETEEKPKKASKKKAKKEETTEEEKPKKASKKKAKAEEPKDESPKEEPKTIVELPTLNDLATKGTELIEAGKMEDLQALLAQYGVESLQDLAKEQYAKFHEDLKTIGGK